MNPQSTLERAFVLARSGDYSSVNDIRARLKGEGFSHVQGHLSGQSISRQLRKLCQDARSARAA